MYFVDQMNIYLTLVSDFGRDVQAFFGTEYVSNIVNLCGPAWLVCGEQLLDGWRL
jgi:hypothetical protein